GANCWCPSRNASDCADCTNPRARSVYFSKFIGTSLLGLFRTPARRDRDIVHGDTPAGLDGRLWTDRAFCGPVAASARKHGGAGSGGRKGDLAAAPAKITGGRPDRADR